MGALLNGTSFRIDPYTVQASTRMKLANIPTLAGRVVQVFGTEWDTLSITGMFGKGGYGAQLSFLEQMRALADTQNDRYKANSAMTFQWPERHWNFSVMLQSYTSPDGPQAVHAAVDTINPRWTLNLFIVEDNGGLKKAAHGEDVFLQRLAEGMGWKQTEYNGPLGTVQPDAAFPGSSDAQTIGTPTTTQTGNATRVVPTGGGGVF